MNKVFKYTLLVLSSIVLLSCNKPIDNSKEQSSFEFRTFGDKHNEGMSYVLNELKIAKEVGNLTMDMRTETNPLAIAKQSTDEFIMIEFCESAENQLIALTCSDSIYNRVLSCNDYRSTWFLQDDGYLSAKQKELLTCLKEILCQDYDLETTLLHFEIVRQRVTQECTDEEAEVLYYAISVGKASCIYWHDHLIEWIELLSENRERGWFSWKSVIGNDIGGAIGGAIAGALFGGGAGAGPGSISGAIIGSVSSAVSQVIEHEF